MSMKDYFDNRAERDPEFREERERLRPEYAFRRALIGARLEANLTQVELAERIGTTQSAIARLESGGAQPSFDMLRRLSAGLNVSFEIMPSADVLVHQQEATVQ